MIANARWITADGPPGAAPARQALAYGAFGLAHLALAAFAANLPVQTRLPLFIWPADGLVLGALLVSDPRRWPAYLAIALCVNLGVGFEFGASWARIVVAGLVNLAVPLFVAVFLQRLAGPRVAIDTVKGVAAFLVGLMPLLAASSVLEAAESSVQFGAPFREQWTIFFASDMLGILLVAPLILAWNRRGWKDALADTRSRLPELAVLYIGLVITTHYVFSSPQQAAGFAPSLAYLCAPFLLWAALAFGLRAATLGLAVFGLICYWHTARGTGPFAVDGLADWTTLLHLQGYLATVVVTTLFAAALLVERREAAQTTHAWRRRYEAVIRASGNLLYELDPRSGAILWDGDTRAVIGVPPEAVAHVDQWTERVHPDDRMRLRGIRHELATGALKNISMEYRMRRDDGEYVTLGVNGFAIEEPQALGPPRRRVIGFVKDISDKLRAEEERRRLESQLKQAEKMEAVGHLAGGIAHDFNNILGAILGYGELAQMRARDEDMKRYLDTIMSAGNRGKSLVTQILAYSRAETTARMPVIVGPVAREACDLVQGSSAKVEVRLRDDSNEAAVLGDPTRLYQLVMNLCTNAVHAMEDGGTLDVAIARERLGGALNVRTGQVPPGEYVVIRVKDSGHGIAPEVIDRIFEPFFTTKRADRGTGLGLALVHSVAKEHHGFIDVESALGKGTTFTVWIPLQPEAALVQAPAEAPAPQGAGQVVLAVDDEAPVLAALEEMLASLGYEPVGFSSSLEALEAIRADPKRFDAIVSDEVMPDMGGTQLALEARRANPTIPIVIATGFGGAGFEARALAAGVNRVMRKPYRMTEIGEALAGVLPSR
jgi:PAS domain S-box-containing protein